jgi:cytochrome c oxidase subunit III
MENEKDIELYYKKATRKAKTNIVWFSIFSIAMLFAGLTSAYIVSKGDNFWVNFSMPSGLWISTLFIILSSLTMILGVNSAKNQNKKKTSLFLLTTLALGLLFTASQYSAWTQLYEKGYSWADKIINPETGEYMMTGKYGEDFTIQFQGNELIQEEGGLFFWGEQAIKIDQEEYTQLEKSAPEMFVGKEFIRVQKNIKDKKTLEAIVKSKMPVSESYLAKLQEVGNVSSSYFYTLTIVHLLHILVTLLYLIAMIILVSRRDLSEDNQLKIKLGGYFWHFFAGLWLYLLLFLFLIH